MDQKVEAAQYNHPSEALNFATTPAFINPEYSEFIDPAKLASVRQQWSQPLPAVPRPSSERNSDELYDGFSHWIPETRGLARGARAATRTEHGMTVTEALFVYKRAIAWSAVLSLTLVMEGFDKTLVTDFFAFPSFRRDYGTQTDGNYQISTSWQASLTSCTLAGEIVGLLLNGFFTDKFGNRKTTLGSLVALSAFIFLSFFAKNLQMLLAAQILCGIPWGIFQTLSTTYAAECTPVALRAYLTSSINLCWLIGQLISSGVLRTFSHDPSPWSYRIPFALQWIWVVPISVGVLLAPESPWWLLKHERPVEARRALNRLMKSSKTNSTKVDESITLMQHTNEVEKHLSSGIGYIDCFRGSDLRRTEIACFTWMTQSICGAMTGYATYFYAQAGLPTSAALDMSIAMYGAGIIGALICWVLMRIAGRRALYLWGTALVAVTLLVVGLVGAFGPTSTLTSWTLGSLIVFLTFVYNCTVGPVCYSLVSEIPSARLRVKTVVLARVAYNILSLITNIIMPLLLNPTAWNWKGKACLLWAGAAILAWCWCWFRLPEPKGLTYMELDVLFEKKAGTRKFKRVQMSLRGAGYIDRGMHHLAPVQ
ncbi:hypothetical protein FQN54_006621 [Arachnomyces sp. PD_36]|nr:hypothetical protein FQN54_006621 [Arachnomyces sp. PD_36]